MAYQYYVLANSGVNIKSVWIMRLKSYYKSPGYLKTRELFKRVDCTDLVIAQSKRVEDDVKRLKSIAMMKYEPCNDVGSQCKEPYPCGYTSWCWRNEAVPSPNVFEIGFGKNNKKFTKEVKAKVYADKLTFTDILDRADELGLNVPQQKQVKATLNPDIDKKELIDIKMIQNFLDELEYPVYHLDFETFQQAIPTYIGVSPYNQIPFQYSLHIQKDADDKNPEHREHLAKEGFDPRKEIASKLYDALKDIGSGTVLAYNVGFERSVIKNLAEWFEEDTSVPQGMCELFRKISDNKTGQMKDLMIPFQNGSYYHPEMGRSASIKSVLPAVLGRDPYEDLTDIKNGGDAMTIFPILHEKPKKEREKLREALIKYCTLDTQAMVWVLEELYKAVKKKNTRRQYL